MTQRTLTPELMDSPAIDPLDHRRALDGLRRVNRFSLTARHLWQTLRVHLSGSRSPTRILDIACGGGDVTLALQQFAQRHASVTVDGCDISRTAVQRANDVAASKRLPSRFFRHDVCDGPMPEGYDAIVCSLFLHHLDDDAVRDLLRRMADATPLIGADDLVRSRSGYAIAWLGTRLLSRSPIVHTDGPRSVRAALTPDELIKFAADAGLDGATVARHFPWRMQLCWSRA